MVRNKRHVYVIGFEKNLNKEEFYKMYSTMSLIGMKILTVVFPEQTSGFTGDAFAVDAKTREMREFIETMHARFPDYEWDFALADGAK